MSDVLIQVPEDWDASTMATLVYRLQDLAADPTWDGYTFKVFEGARLAFAMPPGEFGGDRSKMLAVELQRIFNPSSSGRLH